MKDRPIQVGDLVMVVKPTVCCKSEIGIGMIFKVAAIARSFAHCITCGYVHPTEELRAYDENACGALLQRLKRIPGLGELTQVKIKESQRFPTRIMSNGDDE